MTSNVLDYSGVSAVDVRIWCESTDNVVTPDAVRVLIEDKNYRLREIALKCAVLRQHKRTLNRLNISDVNSVFVLSNVQSYYGHGGAGLLDFCFVDDLNVFVADEGVISTIARVQGLQQSPQCYNRLQDLDLEGRCFTFSSSISEATSASVPNWDAKSESSLKSALDVVAKLLISSCYFDGIEYFVALERIRKCSRIAYPVSVFVEFLEASLENVENSDVILRALGCLQAALLNPAIDLTSTVFVEKFMRILCKCSRRPSFASKIFLRGQSDGWALQTFSAQLIAELVRHWHSRRFDLARKTTTELKEVLKCPSQYHATYVGILKTWMFLDTQCVIDSRKILLDLLKTHVAWYPDIFDRQQFKKHDEAEYLGAWRAVLGHLYRCCAEQLLDVHTRCVNVDIPPGSRMILMNSLTEIMDCIRTYLGFQVVAAFPSFLDASFPSVFWSSVGRTAQQESGGCQYALLPKLPSKAVNNEEKRVSIKVESVPTGALLLERLLKDVEQWRSPLSEQGSDPVLPNKATIISPTAVTPSERKRTSTTIDAESCGQLPTKKRRRQKKKPADVFDIPKKFKLLHQRDIIMVFHSTEAKVHIIERSVPTFEDKGRFNSLFYQFLNRRAAKFHSSISFMLRSRVTTLQLQNRSHLCDLIL